MSQTFFRGHSSVIRAVSFGFGTKLWSLVNIPVQLFLIATFFSEGQQGYYYTFQSLTALQIFAELGLGAVIVACSSHEWAFCSLDKKGGIIGEERQRARLIYFGRLVFRWYFFATLVFVLFLMGGGLYFFGKEGSSEISWRGPFVMLTLVGGLNLLSLPALALLEGCNQVNAIYTMRLWQSLILGLTTWAAILGGLALWTPALAWLALVLFTAYFLIGKYRFFFKTFLEKPAKPEISWTKEIWPFQWRIALSCLAGYFVFSFFSPAVFYFYGPVLAGQVGMTLVIAAGLAAFCNIWTLVYTSKFGQLVSQQSRVELDLLFSKVVKLTGLFTCFATLAAWALIKLMGHYECRIADRLLPSPALEAFLVGNGLLIMSVPFSTYMRAHKEEPLALLHLGLALVVGSMTIFCGKFLTIGHMGLGYACANVCALFGIIALWAKFRSKQLA